MKRVIILILLMLSIIPASKAEKIQFFLTWSVQVENEAERGKLDLFCDHFEYKFYQGIEKYLPCATKTSFRNIVSILDNERERLLLGGPENESLLSDLAGAVGAQYLVSLRMTQMGQSVIMNVKCIKTTEAKTLVNVLDQAPLNEDAFEVITSFTEKFFDDLLKYEICPYKGRLKVEVTTDLNVDQKKEYPVYCNEQDRLYKLHYKETKHSEHFWTFEKETKVWARSFIDYSISEESEKEIDDGCYSCPQGKTRRYYHETISKSGKIDEVSEESELFGKQVSDARVEITFNDDGTYIIKIDATSKESEISVTRYLNAESWCDNENKPPETIKNKVDIPLTYFFGPYQGTAKDEFLTQHPDPIVVTDPISGVKTTYTISFDLSKD
jgi:hypothetical protein